MIIERRRDVPDLAINRPERIAHGGHGLRDIGHASGIRACRSKVWALLDARRPIQRIIPEKSPVGPIVGRPLGHRSLLDGDREAVVCGERRLSGRRLVPVSRINGRPLRNSGFDSIWDWS